MRMRPPASGVMLIELTLTVALTLAALSVMSPRNGQLASFWEYPGLENDVGSTAGISCSRKSSPAVETWAARSRGTAPADGASARSVAIVRAALICSRLVIGGLLAGHREYKSRATEDRRLGAEPRGHS